MRPKSFLTSSATSAMMRARLGENLFPDAIATCTKNNFIYEYDSLIHSRRNKCMHAGTHTRTHTRTAHITHPQNYQHSETE